jgi:hypothetical protein
MTFTIDTDNNITALETAPAEQDGLVAFATEKEFTKATAEWPISRLVETWNSFAGVAPFDDLKSVKKFENRNKAMKRIWAAIQRLAKAIAPHPPQTAAGQAPAAALATPKKASKTKAAKSQRAPKPVGESKTPREGTAKAKVIAMIQRKGGASLESIMKETGWQAHTVRGFMSTLTAKTGVAFTSTRRESDKARVYEAK